MLYVIKKKIPQKLEGLANGNQRIEGGNNIYDKAPQIRITFLREPKVGKID